MKNTIDYAKLQPHPLGAIFPPMDNESYDGLVKSIKKDGFDDREKIVLLDGQILDGNNRYTGLKKARVKPEPKFFQNFNGSDPYSFVVQKNLHRRHLTPSQAAALGAELVEMMRVEEKRQKDEAKAAAKGGKPTKPQKQAAKGSKAGRAAKAVGVSERSVDEASALKKSDPAAFEEVKKGAKRLASASKDAGQKKSAADQKGEEFQKAAEIIDRTCGESFTETLKGKLQSKDIIKLSGIDAAEMLRIKPMLESGWKLNAALGYKSVALVAAHPIRQLLDRCDAQGGNFEVEMEGKRITVADIKAAQPEGAADPDQP